MRHLLLALLLGVAACEPATKPPTPPAAPETYADAATFAGVFVFTGEADAPSLCTLTLRSDVIDGAPDAHSASAGEGCTVAYPVLVTLARWEVIGTDTIRLEDSGGYALGDMTKDAAGLLKGVGEADGKPYTMTPMAVFARQAPVAPETTDTPPAPASAPDPAPVEPSPPAPEQDAQKHK